jgi:hypothetical protein
MITAEYLHDLLGFCAIGERGKAAQVEENDRDLTSVTFEKIFVLP